MEKIKNLNENFDFCYNSKNIPQQLAKHFCGKESVIKALSGIGYKGIYAYNIEISCNTGDISKVQLKNNLTNKLNTLLSILRCQT